MCGGKHLTIAGTGIGAVSGDGGQAINAGVIPIGISYYAGNLFVAQSNNTIREITPDGVITTIAGNGVTCIAPNPCGDGGLATDAQLSHPNGPIFDSQGNLYFADTVSQRIRKITPSGIISTIACLHNSLGFQMR